MCYFVGVMFLLTSMLKDITNDLRILNTDRKLADRNGIEVKRELCNVIQLFSEVKQLSKFITFIGIHFVCVTCSNIELFHLDLQQSSMIFME